jgi:hypothetical protein
LTAEESLLKYILAGSAIHIECTAAELKEATALQHEPLITVPSIDTVVILFTSCTLLPEEGGKKCAVEKKEIQTNKIKGEFVNNEEIKFTPETGTVFAEIKLVNNGSEECPETIAGKEPVTGEQTCSFGSGINEDLKTHILLCEPAKGKLKFGGNTAELLMALTINSPETLKDFWDITLG